MTGARQAFVYVTAYAACVIGGVIYKYTIEFFNIIISLHELIIVESIDPFR
ncbi:hypothetical protein D3C85_1801570 [compost metagenome]